MPDGKKNNLWYRNLKIPIPLLGYYWCAKAPNLYYAEYWTAFVIFIIMLALRITYIFNYSFSSDEPQHLHVVWAWTKGLLQYRDIFDNHAPLFHILYAPVLYFVGERSDVLYFMRLAVLPLFFICLYCVYIIGKNLYSKRAGIWSVVLVSLYQVFFFCSLQFRADILWTVFWLMGLAVILGKPLLPKRSFIAGLFFGLALCTSIKTILLLICLLIVVGITILNGAKLNKNYSRRSASAAVMGFLLIPVLFIIFFAVQRALPQFFYCIIAHNVLPGIGNWNELWRMLIALFLLAIVFFANRRYFARRGSDSISVAKSVLFLTTAVYIFALLSFWPVSTTQNFLPVYPLAGILITALLLKWADLLSVRYARNVFSKYYPVLVMVLISIAEIAAILYISLPWKDRTKFITNMIGQAIGLTDKDDLIIDQKGETVYRMRPYYYALETFTRERLDRGIIPDTIADTVIAKRCYVATKGITRFPQDAQQFLRDNYISIGYVLAAGKFLNPYKDGSNIFKFEVRIPGPYVIIGDGIRPSGTLDGSAYKQGARFLDSGMHEFVSTGKPGNRFALLWAHAYERGFSPFYIAHDDDE